jgi:hypothetical protein
MASKIARAVDARARFIKEYLSFGIACNKCRLDYCSLAMQDFIELCHPPKCPQPTPSRTDIFDCGLSVEDLPIIQCKDAQILECGIAYTRKSMGTLMNHEFLAVLTQNLNQVRWFEFDSIIIDGVSYLGGPRRFRVSQSTLTTFGQQATNIINILNGFRLPNFEFYISNDPSRFEVSFPVSSNWSIRTRYNIDGTHATFGILYTQDGAQDIQSTVGGPYVALSTFVDPPVLPGAIIINKEYSFC